MNITVENLNPIEISVNALVLFAWQDDTEGALFVPKELSNLDTVMGGLLVAEMNNQQFNASPGALFSFHTHGKIKSSTIIVVGLGMLSKLSISSVLLSCAKASRLLRDTKVHTAALLVPSFRLPIDTTVLVQSITEGIILGSYQFLLHKTVDIKNHHSVSSLTMIVDESSILEAKNVVKKALITSDAVIYTRDLVNESPSTTTPTYLGNKALELDNESDLIKSTVFGKSDLAAFGMGGILSIARGSDQEPKFIKLEYHGGGDRTIALIGKGVTFDTGGLSLKPANAMETMKMDMAGAASVLGVFSALSALKPHINVVGLISATENMPGGNAIKPGDVVKAMNGKTIEILNTDAEGRVVLADALSYAVSEVKPDVMIDLATLTGACVIALGEEVSGLFSNNQALADNLLSSAKATGESVWQLPLVDEYRKHIKSPVADIKNIGNGRWGGAITAALFLQEFTSDTIPWAHLDIAGPAFAEKDSALSPFGGTGHAVRLLLHYLTSQS